MNRLLCALAVVVVGQAAMAEQIEVVTVNPNAAWCWFQDERALVTSGSLVTGTITDTGTVELTVFSLHSGERTVVPFHTDFGVDDHNVPGMMMRADGNLMAFYCRHNNDSIMRYRETIDGDPTQWGPQRTLTAGVEKGHGFTYANPFQLSAEKGRIHLFWRAIDFNPTCTWSDDGGDTWATARNHIYLARKQRPYVKYCSNGRDTIHFAYTDGHPRDQENSIRHAFYRDGKYHASDGKVLHACDEGPVSVETGSVVYSKDQAGKAWIWDMHLDPDENPVMVYATVPTIEDHRYRYARWAPDAGKWVESEIAHAGRGLYMAEREYSGGICLDPDNVSVVYASANVDPATGKPTAGGHYEIYKGRTPDRGKSWNWTALTSGSTRDNLRPVVPIGHPGKTFVVWMRGEYPTYTSYKTELVLGRLSDNH